MTYSEEELRRLADAAKRARTVDRTVKDMAGAIRFQDACITAIPELLDAMEAARKDAAEQRQHVTVLNYQVSTLSDELRKCEDLEDAKERLLDIGKVIGCEHVEDEGGRLRLVHCVEEVFSKIESERDAAHSIIADLRRQLAGLGIPTEGETT